MMPTIEQQSKVFWNQLSLRKRNPVKPATLAAYQSHLKTWILPTMGGIQLEDVGNDTLKELVTKMAEKGLSASSMTAVTNTAKAVVASAIDKKGNELYPRTWNNDFIDLPVIDPQNQKSPILSGPEVVQALQSVSGPYHTLFLILAGSGLRISEALALRARPTPKTSYFDPDRRVLVIQRALYHGKEQATKTVAGVREVDLQAALSDRLKVDSPDTGYILTGCEKPLRLRSAYDVAERAAVPGFHSFRRFRVTHLENVGVPRSLIQFWTGHAGKDVTDRYVKIGQDIEARRQWAEKAGLGFEL